jgi:hypothetical protein
MSSFTDKLAALRGRAVDITSQLTSLADKRRSYSLAATEADAKAVKAISDIDFQIDSLRREEATVRSAEEVATALEKQEAVDEQRQQQREREVAAYNVAAAVSALHAEIDDRMVALRQAFERRAALLAELSRSELADPNLLNKLSSKLPATRAACCHRLDSFISIERTSAQGRMPLSDANALLAGIGKAPDPDKPAAKEKRVTLQ